MEKAILSYGALCYGNVTRIQKVAEFPSKGYEKVRFEISRDAQTRFQLAQQNHGGEKSQMF